MTDLAELDRQELQHVFVERGLPGFRGTQVFRWIHKRGVTDPAGMTDLGKDLRDALQADTIVSTPVLARKDVSSDGTTKFLLRLADGQHIEAVYIPDTPNQTFCVSTQVGCAMKCAFC